MKAFFLPFGSSSSRIHSSNPKSHAQHPSITLWFSIRSFFINLVVFSCWQNQARCLRSSGKLFVAENEQVRKDNGEVCFHRDMWSPSIKIIEIAQILEQFLANPAAGTFPRSARESLLGIRAIVLEIADTAAEHHDTSLICINQNTDAVGKLLYDRKLFYMEFHKAIEQIPSKLRLNSLEFEPNHIESILDFDFVLLRRNEIAGFPIDRVNLLTMRCKHHAKHALVRANAEPKRESIAAIARNSIYQSSFALSQW
jgi:hypothetical protein